MRHTRFGVLTSTLLLASVCGLGALGTPRVAQAAQGPSVEISSESKVWFEGDSTIHPFSFKARSYKVAASVAPNQAGSLKEWLAGARLDKLEVEIPVKQLKSGDGTMDGNMYRALEADKYPTIRFSLGNAKLRAGGGDVDVDATGTLSIAGTERPITLKAEGKLDGTTFRLKGSKELQMSDFGVTPPVISLLVAKLTVKDRIVVRYDLTGTLKD